jgi:pimeloyl-ACP methyl ester carboxylesterase
MQLFRDSLHDDFGSWPLGYTAYGGPDLGEIAAVAAAVGAGDDAAFHAAWIAAGDRLTADAETSLAAGHRAGARDAWLRAAACYATSYHPLYGAPVDPRLRAAFARQIDAFDRALALGTPPVAPLRIPFEATSLPGYLVPAEGHATEVRPLLILTNGYDATVTELYLAAAVAAARRGYHCLVFDGHGQGEPLIGQNLPLRPDWETVISAVVDFALTQPIVDPARIALAGWSLGGYLALRAASGEPRLAACVADPGLWGITRGPAGPLPFAGALSQALKPLMSLPAPELDAAMHALGADRRLRWTLVQRGLWTHGVDTLAAYFAAADAFTLDGRAQLIRCPTLLTRAETDRLAAGAPAVLDALTCPKHLLTFTAAEGAGQHCEMHNRSLANRRILDWLDETLA